MKYSIYVEDKFEEWLKTQSVKSKLQIAKRLDRIASESHFGNIRNLGDDLYELKFNDGRRIYYTVIPVNNIILLLGGGKNGQAGDIRKAKSYIQKAETIQKRIDSRSIRRHN